MNDISFMYLMNNVTIPEIRIIDRKTIPNKSAFFIDWLDFVFRGFLLALKSYPGTYCGVLIIFVCSEISIVFLLKKADIWLIKRDNFPPTFGILLTLTLKTNIPSPIINVWIIPSGIVFIMFESQFNTLSTFINYFPKPMRSKISSTRLV